MWRMMMTMLDWSWKVLGITGAWMLFKYMIHDGKETLRDLFETISMALQAGSMTLKRKLWQKIRKEKKGPVTTEGSVE